MISAFIKLRNAGRLLYGVMLVMISLLIGCAEAPPKETIARRGLDAVEFFDFTTGLNLLSQVQPDWPEDDPLWVEITYGLALSAWHASPPRAEWIALAESLFTVIAHKEPDTAVGLQARMNLARLAEIVDFPGDTPDYETATSLYRELIEQPHDPDIAMQAALRLANLQAFTFTEEGVRSAIALILAQLERNPHPDWASVAWQYIGDLNTRFLDDKSAALDAYAEAYALGFVNVPRADAALWRMGQFAEALERTEEAVHWYKMVVLDHPRSIFGTWAHQRMTRLAATLDDPGDLPPPPNPLEFL